MSDAEEKFGDVVENHKEATRDARIKQAEKEHVDVVENHHRIRCIPSSSAWQPGQSGNPGGRPKTKLISHAYRRMLEQQDPNDPEGRTFAEMIALGMIRQAISGEVSAAKEVREVTEGKLPNKIEVSGDISVQHVLSDATDEELDGILEAYLEERYGAGAFPGDGSGETGRSLDRGEEEPSSPEGSTAS